MAPIFYDYPRDAMGLKKVKMTLATFETYLKNQNTKYAAGDHVTLGDFSLISSTMCLEGIAFDLSEFPLVKTWYENFKVEQPELWTIVQGYIKWIAEFDKNSPDMSQMNHPIHPKKK